MSTFVLLSYYKANCPLHQKKMMQKKPKKQLNLTLVFRGHLQEKELAGIHSIR